jgi:hypothetical protein
MDTPPVCVSLPELLPRRFCTDFLQTITGRYLDRTEALSQDRTSIESQLKRSHGAHSSSPKS